MVKFNILESHQRMKKQINEFFDEVEQLFGGDVGGLVGVSEGVDGCGGRGLFWHFNSLRYSPLKVHIPIKCLQLLLFDRGIHRLLL